MVDSVDGLFGSPAAILRHLLGLYGLSQAELIARSAELGSQFALSKNFFSNFARSGVMPLLSHLYPLEEILHLTPDGVSRIFNIRLGALPAIERQINQSFTRVIESYVFDRDRLIDIPLAFAPHLSFARSAYLSDLVESWQRVAVRFTDNRAWSVAEPIYLRVGAEDDSGLPGIPRGAIVRGIPVDAEEARHPDPNRYYVIQHGHGYLCTRCFSEEDSLHLLTNGAFYQGAHQLRLKTEAQILGRVQLYSTALPLQPSQYASYPVHGPPAPLIPPWSHSTPLDLVVIERTRCARTGRQLVSAVEQARELLGFGLSGRQAYELSQGSGVPRTRSLLALAAAFSLRFQDVRRSAGLPTRDANRHSLDTLLWASTVDALPRYAQPDLPRRPATALEASGEERPPWFQLLFGISPLMPEKQLQWFYVNQSASFRGLDTLVPPGSLIEIKDLTARQAAQAVHDEHLTGWERPIYLIRIREKLLCSYVHADREYLTLVPHPNATGVLPQTVRRSESQLLGLATGIIAAPK